MSLSFHYLYKANNLLELILNLNKDFIFIIEFFWIPDMLECIPDIISIHNIITLLRFTNIK